MEPIGSVPPATAFFPLFVDGRNDERMGEYSNSTMNDDKCIRKADDTTDNFVLYAYGL